MTKSKAPAFQFYPADWLSNVKLQSCSMRAQGLLVNLMCYMHKSEKYGYLMLNGRKMDVKQLQNLCKMHLTSLKNDLKSLLNAGVIKEDENGVLYSPRMVRDEQLREMRRRIGKLGGNPNLVNQGVKVEVNPKDNPVYPPLLLHSSSSLYNNGNRDTMKLQQSRNANSDDKKNQGDDPDRPPEHWTEQRIRDKAYEIQNALEVDDSELGLIIGLIRTRFSRINPAIMAVKERIQKANEGQAEPIKNKMAYFIRIVKDETSDT